MRSWIRLILIVALILLCAGVAQACPTCSETLTDGVRPSSIARGFFWSIIAMLSVSFSLVGAIAVLIWRRTRTHDVQPNS